MNSGRGDGYLSWDDDDDDEVEMDRRVGAPGNIGNNFFHRLWCNGNQAFSGGFGGQRRRLSY